MRVGPIAVLSRAAATYITVVRNTPLVMIFIIISVALPNAGNHVQVRRERRQSNGVLLPRPCLALSLYTSTFVAEAIRSGINAVSLGQAEAARAIGLTFGGTMTQVILPQAFRATVPPLASVFIALLKNTLGRGCLRPARGDRPDEVLHNQTARDERVFLLFALGYVVLVEIISFGASRLERRWRVSQ